MATLPRDPNDEVARIGKSREIVVIDYTNHRGVREPRKVLPISISFTKSQWHPGGPRWILTAYAMDRREQREFALSNIHSWKEND